MVTTILISALVAGVISIIPMWRLFEKAGQPGWKAIIPVYSSYMLYKISWKPSMFFITLILGIVASILLQLNDYMALAVIGVIINIAVMVLGILFNHKISKSFGHGVGFTVGLIFLSLIFLYILAFGSSEYQGAQD